MHSISGIHGDERRTRRSASAKFVLDALGGVPSFALPLTPPLRPRMSHALGACLDAALETARAEARACLERSLDVADASIR